MDELVNSDGTLDISTDSLVEFCRRWHISKLALFGSVLRPDFHPRSDIDLLATFDDTSHWGLLDHIRMEQELQALFGREIDLISYRALARSANWLRREAILTTAQTIYRREESTDGSG